MQDNLSPLHVAAGMGHIEVTKRLLDNGAHMEAEDNALYTPLWRAAYYGHPEVVEVRVCAVREAVVGCRPRSALSLSEQLEVMGIILHAEDRQSKTLDDDAWGREIDHTAYGGWYHAHRTSEGVRVLCEDIREVQPMMDRVLGSWITQRRTPLHR